MYRIDIGFDHDADYVEYWYLGGSRPSECIWMIPGTWVED